MEKHSPVFFLFEFFSRKKVLLFGLTLVVVGVCLFFFTRIRMAENITAMLPDDGTRTTSDFQLLNRAPFLHRILINLEAGPNTEVDVLIQAADDLTLALTPPLFTRAVSGPPESMGPALIIYAQQGLPNLVTEKDLLMLSDRISPERIRSRMEENKRLLTGPEGLALKNIIRSDPLGLRELALSRLKYINLFSNMRLSQGHFMSADGKNILIIAETNILITDSKGVEPLLAKLDWAVKKTIPPGVTATPVNGHAYTQANAQAIKKDLFVLITASTLGIVLVILLLLSLRMSLFVLAVPLCALCAGGAAAGLFFSEVSGITLGFGAVLMGLSADYGIYVYFALRREQADRASRLMEVARPIFFGWLTSMAVFILLMFSNLPGLRQLGLFSLAGLTLASLLALVIFPHCVRFEPPRPTRSFSLSLCGTWFSRWRTPVLLIWLVLLVGGVWLGREIRFESDLRALALVPPRLIQAEDVLRRTWGDVRGQAFVFAEGQDLDSAMAANTRVFHYLSQKAPDVRIISLAPLLPPGEAQQKSGQRWQEFWRDKKKNVTNLVKLEAKRLGFAPMAFEPFYVFLNRPNSPVTVEGWQGTGLSDLTDMLILKDQDRVRIITLVPDTAGMRALFPPDQEKILGARLVSQARFKEEAGMALRRDFFGFIIASFIAVMLITLALFRSAVRTMMAFVPVITGLCAILGFMGVWGLSFSMYTMVGLMLLMGTGVDYGIFMVNKIERGLEHGTEQGVLASGLTCIAGFGALALAKHPALSSIGQTVLVGMSSAMISALLVIPLLYRPRIKPA